MTVAQPPPKVRERLIKLLWLTDNANDHERAIAAAKFMALLKEHNLTPSDVLAPPPINQVVQIISPSAPAHTPSPPPPRPPRDWHTVVQDIIATRASALYESERRFLPDLLRKGYAPRGGQIPWLIKIIKRVRVAPWDIKPWDTAPGDTSPWDCQPEDGAS